MEPSAPTTPTPFSARVKTFVIMPRRKQRCWIFRVGGITKDVSKANLLASVCKRYSTVKRLVVRSEPSSGGAAAVNSAVSRNAQVEIEFTGPLPSEGLGALLCNALCGSSVEAKPVELPRGRKKRPRTDEASPGASDSGVEEGRWKKVSGHRSINSRQQVSKGEEEENLSGSGRCISVKHIRGASARQGLALRTVHGHSGPQVDRPEDDELGSSRRTSVRDTKGPVAAKFGLTPLSLTGLLTTSTISSQAKPPSSSHVVVSSALTTMPELTPADHPQMLPLDTAQRRQQQQHLFFRNQRNQNPNQVQNQPRQTEENVGAQRDDFVGCMSSPKVFSQNLNARNIDIPSRDHPVVDDDFECLFVSPSSGGMWRSNDNESALFGSVTLPPPMQPLLRGWLFDSPHTSETTDGDFNSEKMLMDLFDVDEPLHLTAEGEIATRAATSSVSARSAGSNADAVARSRQEQAVSPKQPGGSEGMLPMEKVVIEPSPQECDFDGRSVPTTSPRSPTLSFPDGQCHMVFTGLEKTGHDFRSLRVTAHFGIDSVHKVGEGTGPVKMGEDGRAFATVCYPSMREIWPELYCTGNVQVIQVDVAVEIRSDCGKFRYVGPQLKVAYCRTPPTDTGVVAAAPRPLLQGRQISCGEHTQRTASNPQTPDSRKHHSCFDRLSDMCHSVFSGGGVTREPMPDTTNDLMNAHP